MIQPTTRGGAPLLITWAKGSTVSFTIPANQRFDLLWLALSYTCSAVAATRNIAINLTCLDGIVVPLVTEALTANLSGIISTGLGQTSTVGNYGLLDGPITMYAGQIIGVTIGNADAGDTWIAEGLGLTLPLWCP